MDASWPASKAERRVKFRECIHRSIQKRFISALPISLEVGRAVQDGTRVFVSALLCRPALGSASTRKRHLPLAWPLCADASCARFFSEPRRVHALEASPPLADFLFTYIFLPCRQYLYIYFFFLSRKQTGGLERRKGQKKFDKL